MRQMVTHSQGDVDQMPRLFRVSDPAPKRIASGDLKPGNLALMPTLMLSIGLLVLLSVGLIVAVNWVTGRTHRAGVRHPPHRARAFHTGDGAAATP